MRNGGKYIEANIPDGLRVQVRYLKHPVWVTSCFLIENATGKTVAHAQSVCSKKDQPVRKIGRAIAVGRVLKLYFETPSRRVD